MMKKYSCLLLALCVSAFAFADLRLPKIFGSNMVLQRDKPIPVWGWADPGEKISVSFNKQTKTTKAGKDGSWKIELSQESAGGPYQLVAKGKNSVALENVLVGEVWICSGQSNMEFLVKGVVNADKEIAQADFPQIRHINVPNAVAGEPAKDMEKGEWIAASPATVGNFTAVGYFFARKLYNELHVPIGLINSSWGGTMVETWISRGAFEKTVEFKDIFSKVSFKELEDAAKQKQEKDKAAGTKSDDDQVGPNSYPSLLFNGMINPLIPFAIKGAIWYQGETNAGRAYEYRKSFPLLISDWRAQFKQGDFPFYFVQLASWIADNGNSTKGSSWAELREAQTMTLSLPHTGMAVALDIGETNDIHPKNKQDVGVRLAAIALNDDYGKKGEWSGPVYQSLKIEGNKAILEFTHAEGGFTVKDKYGYIKGFEIAGEDKQFHFAKANIENNRIVVYSDSVANPVAVHYGWADDMPEADLYNKQGFPAQPFRTDTWKGITETVKYEVNKNE